MNDKDVIICLLMILVFGVVFPPMCGYLKESDKYHRCQAAVRDGIEKDCKRFYE